MFMCTKSATLLIPIELKNQIKITTYYSVIVWHVFNYFHYGLEEERIIHIGTIHITES